jgi:hypothetical protein
MQHVYRLAACLALWVTTASLHAQNITVYADFNLFEIFGATTETSVGSQTKNGITITNLFRATAPDVTPEGMRLFSSTISDDADLLLIYIDGVANPNYRLLGYTIAPHPADPNLDGDESFRVSETILNKHSISTNFSAGYHAITDFDFQINDIRLRSSNPDLVASEVRLESFRIGIIPEPRSSALLLGTFSALAIWGYRRRSKILPRCR